jgi:hypothetical protein
VTVGTNQVAFVHFGLNEFSAVMMREHAADAGEEMALGVSKQEHDNRDH